MQEKVESRALSESYLCEGGIVFSLLLHHFSVLIFIITYFSDDNKQFKENQYNLGKLLEYGIWILSRSWRHIRTQFSEQNRENQSLVRIQMQIVLEYAS